LWKLSIIPKVRAFWWRVFRGILSDYGTLTRQRVMVKNTCGISKAEPKTLMHVLIECNHAILFQEATMEILLVKLPRLHLLKWAEDIIYDPLFNQWGTEIIIIVMYSI
jgi:hypothetical protein